MCKKFLFIFSLFLFSQARGQQADIQVYGKVIEKDTSQPLEYATITFIDKKQNKIAGGGITDAEGKFNVSISRGVYDISIEFISFKTIHLPEKKIVKDTNLGIISLDIDSEALDAVVIRAEKTTVEIKLDKKIYNVGKDLTVRGGSVSDVLDNVPSVSVDVEGNVALRGSDDVRILINGKPSALTGLDSAEALRQLPAESIARVEVITSPSARYDAEGTAGIINIILRRSKLKGLNGSITLTAGNPFQAGISGNINYRIGAFNFFNTTGYNYRKVPGSSYAKTEFFNDTDPSTFIEESRTFDRIRKGINTNTGVEIHLNKTTSVTTSVFYANSDNENNTINFIDELDAADNLLNRSTRKDPGQSGRDNLQYTFNFDKQFNGNSQHKLSMTAQYEDSDSDENSLINQDGIDIENVKTDRGQNQLLLQADYVQPIGKNGQFEVGYRGQFKKQITDYFVATSDDGQTFTNNADLSNDLHFNQDTNAAYTQFGNKIGDKFSYLFGLRVEATNITIEQKTSNDYKQKEYINYFPTVNLGYAFTKKQSITLGFNRRIRRPRSWFLNPFPSRSSLTNLFQGNPDLDPIISSAVDLGYLTKIGKLTLNGSVYYQHATDMFSFVSMATGETVNIGGADIPVIKRMPINLATNDRYGGEITLSYRPSNKFSANANVNLYQSDTKGTYEDQVFDAESFSWFARLNTKYTLPGDIAWQTRVFYRGPKELAQGTRNAIFSTSVAFSKDILNDKASLSLNIRDLFNSNKRSMETLTDDYSSINEYRWRSRSVNLSFTYRFNQKKPRKRPSNNNNEGGDDMNYEG